MVDGTDRSLWLGAMGGWAGWFLSHLVEINHFLQFVLLVTSIAATWAAFSYHRSRTKK
jgi:hypothetical protein